MAATRVLPWLVGALLAACGWFAVHAVERVVVLGLFKDKAVVVVDGRQHLLRVGDTSPEGVTLVEADSESALLQVNGGSMRLRLGSRIETNYEAPAPARAVRVLPDSDNMYTVTGSVNGFSLRFVLDTGASAVALNGNEARRIGIDYARTGVAGYADTPAGPVPTHRVTLDRVRVGEIELRDVEALIIEGSYPREALLNNTKWHGKQIIEGGGTTDPNLVGTRVQDDFTLVDYNPHPHIKGVVAI